jgi:antitoxin component YwqK of YwqJK toxin-antitoxin module
MRKLFFYFTFISICFAQEELLSIHLLDQHGLYQTHQEKEKLKAFAKQNFLSNQPYQKVVRIYRPCDQKIKSIITGYYSSGQICAYLVCEDGRPKGEYKEWYEDGHLKIEAFIEGGLADLTSDAKNSWIFHKLAQVYYPDGKLQAACNYAFGKLHGPSTYYYPNQKIKKLVHFYEDKKHLKAIYFYESGGLKKEIHYQHGKKQGPCQRFFEDGTLYAIEHFEMDKLNKGTYYEKNGSLLSKVEEGAGKRAAFKQDRIIKTSFMHGVPLGRVEIFKKGYLHSFYHTFNGKKHGKQVEFFEMSQLPKVSIFWVEDQIQGLVKTWYPNNQLQSQVEMSHNQKHGISMGYYESGEVMFFEEYTHGRLKHGKYYKKGQKKPVSEVADGKGLATLFDQYGNFDKEIVYERFEPVLKE